MEVVTVKFFFIHQSYNNYQSKGWEHFFLELLEHKRQLTKCYWVSLLFVATDDKSLNNASGPMKFFFSN